MLALALAGAGCGDDDDSGAATTPAVATTTGGEDPATATGGDDPFDSELGRTARENFATSCERSSGGQADYCECVFDGLRAKPEFSQPEDFAKLDRIAADAEPGEIPDALRDVVMSCRSEIS